MFDLAGKKAKDKITGFTGIITARVEYLTGCTQYGITPPMKEGEKEAPRADYFDEGRIEILGEGIQASEVKAPDDGGPNRDAPSR
jgi:hypothetical protein